jgi:hypothetical protein
VINEFITDSLGFTGFFRSSGRFSAPFFGGRLFT